MSDNRVICVNGHYYDGSRYTRCPHCADGLSRIEPAVYSTTEKKDSTGAKDKDNSKTGKRFSFFRKKSEEHEEEFSSEPDKASQREASVDKSGDNGGVIDEADHSLTRGLQEVPQTEEIERKKPNRNCQDDNAPMISRSSPSQHEDQVEQKKEQTHKQSLSTAFEEAIAPRNQSIDKSKTMGYFSTGGKTEPPVGYLICTAGDDYGVGFQLKSGQNTLGRGMDMDVVIMDPKVSREKQAFVLYDPKSRKFYVRPGEGSGLCYLNNELVMSSVELHQFDRLILGDTELMLIAVCCEQFSWDDKV